jgi:ketosteroid isomerase-like protein
MIDLAGEEQAIRKLTAAAFAAEIRRDLEAFVSYFAPDVVVQPEGAPTIAGRSFSRGRRGVRERRASLP